ncbi:hypothetical protein QBC38DRAFT_513505 [Podospora fimiseda]|uniref:Zn(2)-C6 fungal-type domain-containing protein n=1 Tax=Podospora fimiseda TaxID=252190 RepID=A0AAN6YLM8_9PEZI|nr:hypothetical protein QBC38DRAFT_513505 [Podospora fimiseda]
MPPIDYSKWDNIDTDSEEEATQPLPQPTRPAAQRPQPVSAHTPTPTPSSTLSYPLPPPPPSATNNTNTEPAAAGTPTTAPNTASSISASTSTTTAAAVDIVLASELKINNNNEQRSEAPQTAVNHVETDHPPAAPSLTREPTTSTAPIHPQYAADAAAAIAAAHAHAQGHSQHSLQALQAAVSAPPPTLSLRPSPPPVTSSQYAPPPDASGYLVAPPVVAPVVQSVPPATPPPKQTRLRRACDMCSQRKVKCNETQPCRPCTDLSVECTFNRTMKRRGPPNKHAEAAKAAKQPRLEPNITPTPHNPPNALLSISGCQDTQMVLDAEMIAPFPVLTQLVDDFFTYIHPLAPFPHEPTFRHSFLNREDRTNRDFLALLASMVGVLVASFPRTARLRLQSQPPGINLYPKAITLIERCRDIALAARGQSFYAKEDVTVYDAATSYFLGLAAGYMMQMKVCKRFMAETMAFIREMGYHKPRDMGSNNYGITYRGPPFNHIEDQLGKRIFWCMFLGVRSMVQLGAPQGEIVFPPPTPTEPYPDFPAEVDDDYILRDQILCQPDGLVSLMAGFNQAIRIYMTMNGLVSIELAYGISSLEFNNQRDMLGDCLGAVKQVMNGLPRELSINLDMDYSEASHALTSNLTPNGAPTNAFESTPSIYYCPPVYPYQSNGGPDQRRRLQYEIQKANIYVSQIATRSYYVERYLNLRDAHREHARMQAAQVQALAESGVPNGGPGDASKIAAAALHTADLRAAPTHPDPIDAHMLDERELIVRHLLTVLATVSQRNMEPNGGSLINKIRQVASTLVNAAPDRKGPVAIKAEQHLHKFIQVLLRLERAAPVNANHPAVTDPHLPDHGSIAHGMISSAPQPLDEDEEAELHNWIDFGRHQMNFVRGGGFMSLV